MSISSDFTIIGSGIISLLTAKELVNAGASVSILEKSAIGQESSWAGGGILLPLYPWRQDASITQLVMQSLKLYPDLAEQLTEFTGIDPERSQCGLLITKNPDYQKATAWCKQQQIPFEQATPEQLSRFQTQAQQPLWLPTVAQARNPRLLKSLVQYLKNKNVEFRQNCELTGLNHQQRRIQTIETSLGRFQVNQLILATGAWSGVLWEDLFSALPASKPDINPVTGQIVLFEATEGFLNHMILDGDQYLIPRLDGKILAGSSVEYRGFDKSTSAEKKQQLTDFAIRLFPELADFPVIRHWAGLRPGTRHGIPYICKHPDFENLSINAGHFRNGLVMGPASAQLLADMLLGRTPALDNSPYSFDATH